MHRAAEKNFKDRRRECLLIISVVAGGIHFSGAWNLSINASTSIRYSLGELALMNSVKRETYWIDNTHVVLQAQNDSNMLPMFAAMYLRALQAVLGRAFDEAPRFLCK